MKRRILKGFTLIEILLVVALISLLAGGAGFISYNSFQKLQVERTARDIMLLAKFARIRSIEVNYPVELYFDIDGQRFFLRDVDGNYSSEDEDGDIVNNPYAKIHQMPDGVGIESLNILPQMEDFEASIPTKIVFMPEGTADTAVVQVGDGRNHCTIQVSPATGRAKFFNGAADDIVPLVVDLDIQE